MVNEIPIENEAHERGLMAAMKALMVVVRSENSVWSIERKKAAARSIVQAYLDASRVELGSSVELSVIGGEIGNLGVVVTGNNDCFCWEAGLCEEGASHALTEAEAFFTGLGVKVRIR